MPRQQPAAKNSREEGGRQDAVAAVGVYEEGRLPLDPGAGLRRGSRRSRVRKIRRIGSPAYTGRKGSNGGATMSKQRGQLALSRYAGGGKIALEGKSPVAGVVEPSDGARGEFEQKRVGLGQRVEDISWGTNGWSL